MIASVIWNNGCTGSLNAATRNLIVFYITTALYKDRQKVLLNFMNNTDLLWFLIACKILLYPQFRQISA